MGEGSGRVARSGGLTGPGEPGGDTRARSATVRAFIALAPPDDAKDELAEALGPAYETYPRMRWNRIEDWHITLAFLGELPVATVPPVSYTHL